MQRRRRKDRAPPRPLRRAGDPIQRAIEIDDQRRRRKCARDRDGLLHLQSRVLSPVGPAGSPLWRRGLYHSLKPTAVCLGREKRLNFRAFRWRLTRDEISAGGIKNK